MAFKVFCSLSYQRQILDTEAVQQHTEMWQNGDQKVLTAMARDEVSAQDTAAKHGSQKAKFNTLYTVCILFSPLPSTDTSFLIRWYMMIFFCVSTPCTGKTFQNFGMSENPTTTQCRNPKDYYMINSHQGYLKSLYMLSHITK